MLETANTNDDLSLCATSVLNIANTDKFYVNVASIADITEGYNGYDTVSFILTESILMDDDIYEIEIGKNVILSDACGTNYKKFEVSNISEDSGNTVIEVYGSQADLESLFGSPLVVGDVDCIELGISDAIQYATDYGCKIPKFQINGFTGNSATINIVEDFDRYEKIKVHYKKENSNTWGIFEFTGAFGVLGSLDSDTVYFLKVLGVCEAPTFISDFSNLQSFKTL